MNKKNRGFLLVALGAILVAAGLGLYSLQQRQDQLAGENSALLLEALNFELKFNSAFFEETEPTQSAEPGQNETETPVPGEPIQRPSAPQQQQQPEQTQPEQTQPKMPSRTLSGYKLIGVLRAPTVKVELPVLADWSYPLLNVAPCRYSGSLDTGNLIILGHNYKSHLQPMERLTAGAPVEFTDANGVTHRFVVDAVENIHQSDPEKLASDHPLIIFTCTRDGNYRIVIRCSRVEQ